MSIGEGSVTGPKIYRETTAPPPSRWGSFIGSAGGAIQGASQQETTAASLEKRAAPDNLTDSLHQTKNKERRLLFDVLNGKLKKINDTSTTRSIGLQTKNPIKNHQTFLNKIIHHVLNEMAKEGKELSKTDIDSIAENLKIDSEFLNKNFNKSNFKDLLAKKIHAAGIKEAKAKKIASSVIAEYRRANRHPDKSMKELEKITGELEQLLENKPADKDLEKWNFKVIQKLRKAFKSDAYQALKEDEDNPIIRKLHDLNLAMYTETPLLQAYLEKGALGDKISEMGKEKPLWDRISSVRTSLHKDHKLFKSHGSLKYIWRHTKQFFGAFVSQKVGSALADYDPHGKLGNNAGALYEEKVHVGQTDGRLLDVRTPSPTIGKEVSPEFRAALQAIENQRVRVMAGGESLGRPNVWVYTNYQDMTNKMNGEHDRSMAIMRLNDEFPLSFKGMTLSKDSEFYKDGLGHEKDMWDNVNREGFEISQNDDDYDADYHDAIDNFVKGLVTNLKDKAHFTLENRTKQKGGRLYFPDEVKFKGYINEVEQLTRELLHKMTENKENLTETETWAIKMAAKEFAYAALQRMYQADILADLAKQGLKPDAITTSACKEDIDRGFSDHVKRMAIYTDASDDQLAGMINMPALMARYRVILADRQEPSLAFLEHALEHAKVLLSSIRGLETQEGHLVGVTSST